MAANKTYIKLPGSGRRSDFLHFIGGTCTLWQAHDHLLMVESNGIIENYRRFYFKDIQSVILTRTHGWIYYNIIMLLLTVLAFAALAFGSEDNTGAVLTGFAAIVFLISLFALLLSLYRGPSCIMRIITAVQDEIIPSASRQRNALNILNIIKTQCQNKQGVLSMEDILNTPVPQMATLSGRSISQVIKKFDGKYHLPMFLLILVQGILTGFDVLNHAFFYNYIQAVLGTVISIIIILAIYKQQGSNAPDMVKTLTWVTISFMCVLFTATFIVMMSDIMPAIEKSSQFDIYKAMLNVSPNDSPPMRICYIVSFIGYTLLGGAGSIYMLSKRQGKKR